MRISTGQILLSALYAGLVLDALILIPSVFYLRTARRFLRLDLSPGSPGYWWIWLELVPILGLLLRFYSASRLRRGLRERGGEEEAAGLFGQHRLEWSSGCGLVAFLVLAFWFAAFAARGSAPEFWINVRGLSPAILSAVFWVLVLQLWLLIVYRRSLSEAAKGRPIEDAPLVKVLPKQGCLCEVAVAAPVAQVRAACLAWAEDLGWRQRQWPNWPNVGTCLPLVFTRRGCNGNITVNFWEEDVRTHVSFTAFPDPGRQTAERMRVCETFARGVCSDLAASGVAVIPEALGLPKQSRERLKGLRKWLTCYRLTMAGVGLALLVYAITAGATPAYFGAFLAFMMLPSTRVVSERSIGMTAAYSLAHGTLCIEVAMGLTVASFWWW